MSVARPNSSLVAATRCGATPQIGLWNGITGRQEAPPLLGHTKGGVSLAFDCTGRYLLSTEWSDVLRVWDAATGRLIFQTPLRMAHTNVVFGPDGEAAAAVDGQKLRLFRVYPGEGLRVVPPADRMANAYTGRFAVEPSGRVLAVWQDADRTALLDAENGRELGALPGKTVLVGSARGDGSLLTVGDRGLTRWAVQVAGGVCRVGPPERLDLPRHNRGEWGVSADGGVIGVPDFANGAFVWDRKRPGEVRPTMRQNSVRHVAVSPDGRWVVAASHVAGGVSASDARTGKFVRWLIPDGGGAVFSPGGRWVGVWSFRGGATLFRAGTWEQGRLVGDGPVAFSPDDRLVAVGKGDGVVRLVAAETGQEVSRLETTDQTSLQPVGFSPDGGRLYAVGGVTGALYIWDLRHIRARLKAMDADWDWPAFSPPAGREGEPIEVRIVGDG